MVVDEALYLSGDGNDWKKHAADRAVHESHFRCRWNLISYEPSEVGC
mgnify:CR=1